MSTLPPVSNNNAVSQSLTSNQPITFKALGNVYHQFVYVDQNATAAVAFKNLLEKFATNEANGVRDAIASLSLLIKNLKENPPDTQYKSFDRDVVELKASGATLIQQLQEANNKDSLTILIKRISTAARSIPLKGILQKEAEDQQSMIQSAKLAGGFIGLYKIVMKQNNLQYTLTDKEKTREFLLKLATSIPKIIYSFSQKKEYSPPENVALTALATLVEQVCLHRNSFQDLYFPNSETESFINQLTALEGNKEKQKEFYQKLKQATLSHCEKSITSTIGKEELITFFDSKEKEISLPEMADNNKVVGAQIAAAISIWSGKEVALKSQPINVFSLASRESAESEKIQQRFKEIGEQREYTYHKLNQLSSIKYRATNSGMIEEHLTDPIEQARLTVGSLIDYEISQYERAHMIIGGLDIAQREALEPEMAKKVILHGINNDIFSMDQGKALLNQYNLIQNSEIQAAIRAAVKRFEAKQLDEIKKNDPD